MIVLKRGAKVSILIGITISASFFYFFPNLFFPNICVILLNSMPLTAVRIVEYQLYMSVSKRYFSRAVRIQVCH